MKLLIHKYDPALAVVKPVAINGRPSSLCAKLHPTTKNPTKVSIAPKTQVSTDIPNLNISMISFLTLPLYAADQHTCPARKR